MLITPNFVCLNNPKTGSSFVRKAIKELYKKDLKKSLMKKVLHKLKLLEPNVYELILPNIKMPGRHADQHGTYSQIPERYLNREVISVVRNPYDLFLSGFEYKFWARYPPVDKSFLLKKFPSFPDLNIDQYIDLQLYAAQARLGNITNKMEIGNHTIMFIQMFFNKPNVVLGQMNEDYFHSGRYKNDMGRITFLRQENLNEELYNFLNKFNYTDEQLQFIKNFNKVNVTQKGELDRGNLWSKESIQRFNYHERFLFKILSDIGISYRKLAPNKI